MKITVGQSEVDVRVEACLSMPRLAFTANTFAWVQALMPLNIRPTMGTGVFWDQVHTRVWEGFIDKCEYLLLIDYDSFFSQSDIEHLFALALTFQCDALAPLQTKREDGRPMLTLKGNLDNPPEGGTTAVPREWFAAPVQEVDTAHFGCTIISTAALKRCKKPWFWSTPAPDGTWGDGRRDSDIFFWANWRESGNKVFVTPRVAIGHGEYVVTWPGKDLGKPVFQWTSSYTETHKAPESAWRAPE
jgi:hypothetical protein